MIKKRNIVVALAGLTALAGGLIAMPGHASAHERRAVGGKYQLVVGFLVEPAYIEDANGVDVRVTNTETNQPVEGVDKTLKVEVGVGADKKVFDLKGQFGKPGSYKAEFIPTKSGTYTFRFFGEIEGTQVEERFESGPGRFNDVQTKSTAQFPAPVPTNGELAARQQPAQAQPVQVQRMHETSNTPAAVWAFGIAGMVMGLIGMGMAGLALRSRKAETRAAAMPAKRATEAEPV